MYRIVEADVTVSDWTATVYTKTNQYHVWDCLPEDLTGWYADPWDAVRTSRYDQNHVMLVDARNSSGQRRLVNVFPCLNHGWGLAAKQYAVNCGELLSATPIDAREDIPGVQGKGHVQKYRPGETLSDDSGLGYFIGNPYYEWTKWKIQGEQIIQPVFIVLGSLRTVDGRFCTAGTIQV